MRRLTMAVSNSNPMKTDKMKTIEDAEIENVLELFMLAEEASEADEVDTANAAFDAAKVLGWDWEADSNFSSWCLKATQQEIAKEGRNRFIDWLNRFFDMAALNEKLTARGYPILNAEEEAVFLSFNEELADERAAMLDHINLRCLAQ